MFLSLSQSQSRKVICFYNLLTLTSSSSLIIMLLLLLLLTNAKFGALLLYRQIDVLCQTIKLKQTSGREEAHNINIRRAIFSLMLLLLLLLLLLPNINNKQMSHVLKYLNCFSFNIFSLISKLPLYSLRIDRSTSLFGWF